MPSWPRKHFEQIDTEGAGAKVTAKALHFKFEDVATANAYAAVELTQVDENGAEIASDDPRYALDDTGKIVARSGLVNACLDLEETGSTNGITGKLQIRNIGASTWLDLSGSEEAVSAGSAANAFDNIDGHARLQVLVKSTSSSSPGTAAGYLTIS